MRLLLVISGLVATAIARPEPPVGYNYPAPSAFSIGSSLGPAQVQIPSFQSAPGAQFSLSHGSGNFASSIGSGFTTSGNGGNFGDNSVLNGLQGSSFGYASGASVIHSGPSTVHKHVYVHVAPEEPEEIHQHKPIVVGAPQKHYKIIFIKAPAPPKPVVPIIPLQQQNEEKTLVYVLVKKPEDAPEIQIPTPAPTQPAKPEVYFIKYQTKKDIAGGSTGHQISDGSILNSGANILSTHSLGDAGSSNGQSINFDASLGSSNGLTFGPSSIGDGNIQLSNSVGISSSAGTDSKYGPPGYHK